MLVFQETNANMGLEIKEIYWNKETAGMGRAKRVVRPSSGSCEGEKEGRREGRHRQQNLRFW